MHTLKIDKYFKIINFNFNFEWNTQIKATHYVNQII